MRTVDPFDGRRDAAGETSAVRGEVASMRRFLTGALVLGLALVMGPAAGVSATEQHGSRIEMEGWR
jgi:hypothetical protein